MIKPIEYSEPHFDKWVYENYGYNVGKGMWVNSLQYSLRLEIMKRYCFEFKSVLIMIQNNASGFIWVLSKTNGTSLGFSGFSGPNDSGCWDDYFDCLEHAVSVVLNFDLSKFDSKNDHWSNYAKEATFNLVKLKREANERESIQG